MGGVKETICSRCTKKTVCKFTDDYITAMEAYDHIKIPELFSFKLECREREDSQGSFKR